MIKVKTRSGELAVLFHHCEGKSPHPEHKGEVVPATWCSIHELRKADGKPKKKAVSRNVAYCSPVDKFSKARGRQLALTRTIKNFSRSTRKKIWAGYFDQCKIAS